MYRRVFVGTAFLESAEGKTGFSGSYQLSSDILQACEVTWKHTPRPLDNTTVGVHSINRVS